MQSKASTTTQNKELRLPSRFNSEIFGHIFKVPKVQIDLKNTLSKPIHERFFVILDFPVLIKVILKITVNISN